MQKMASVRRLSVLGLAAVGALLLASANQADARPQYFKAFTGKYSSVKSQATKVKCNVCHFGKKKTNRNDWGKAVMKHVGKKNQKDPKAIDAALEKAEKEKNAKGVTFGSLIKAGKLPGTVAAE
jgi:hypothetical protein